jgi:hypothetical protein
LPTALGWPTRADVLIGLAGPMTGKEAWLGEQFPRDAELAVADLNTAGGVLGQKVELTTARSHAAGKRRPEPPSRYVDQAARWSLSMADRPSKFTRGSTLLQGEKQCFPAGRQPLWP